MAIKTERKSNKTCVTRFPPPLRHPDGVRERILEKYVNLVGLSFFGLLVNGFVRVRPSRERNRREECFSNNNKCLYCSLDKNTYPMLQDKKIKSSAKLQ